MSKRDYHRKADIPYTRLPRQALTHLAVELQQRVALERLLIHTERDIFYSAWIETDARSIKTHQARRKKTGADHQHQGQRYFRSHDRTRQQGSVLMCPRRVLAVLDALVQSA